MPPDPDRLAARYGDVERRADVVDLDPERFDRALERGDDGAWGVGALVVHHGRVLMVREGDTWLLPGGRLEPGESPEAGARREVREETGVAVEITDLAAIADRTFRRAGGAETYEFVFATFLASPASDEPPADPVPSEASIDRVTWRERIPEDTFDRGLVVTLAEASR
jgi:ADP-ribose pyrophosphatase YjhB (NUDIX family)